MCLPYRTVEQVSQAATTSDADVDGKLTRFSDISQESGVPVSLDSHTNGNTENDSEEEKDICESHENGTNEQDITEEADTDIVTKKRKTKKHMEVISKTCRLIEISLTAIHAFRIGWSGSNWKSG